mmetsp:Transcript_22924/g.46684  ORF Transcript_22924/g.46684 Transcript_22924/m.46684 type:complete len:89 (+) Transcript_22924:2-268(+)
MHAVRGMVLGGVLYTVGLVPWACRHREYHTAVWHAFVLAASAVFYGVIHAEVATPSIFWEMGCSLKRGSPWAALVSTIKGYVAYDPFS